MDKGELFLKCKDGSTHEKSINAMHLTNKMKKQFNDSHNPFPSNNSTTLITRQKLISLWLEKLLSG